MHHNDTNIEERNFEENVAYPQVGSYYKRKAKGVGSQKSKKKKAQKKFAVKTLTLDDIQ